MPIPVILSHDQLLFLLFLLIWLKWLLDLGLLRLHVLPFLIEHGSFLLLSLLLPIVLSLLEYDILELLLSPPCFLALVIHLLHFLGSLHFHCFKAVDIALDEVVSWENFFFLLTLGNRRPRERISA